MKKLIIFILIFAFVFVLCSCGNEEVISETNTTTTEVLDYTDDTTHEETGNDEPVSKEEVTVNNESSKTEDANSEVSSQKQESKDKVDLADPDVIVGRWKEISKLKDGENVGIENMYLVVTTDFKYYPTNSINSYSGDLTYTYSNGKLTVNNKNKVEMECTVSMATEDLLTLKYSNGVNEIEENFEKVK